MKLAPPLVAAALAVLATAPASARPRLDPPFTDRAVLQRGRPIAVRGAAEPGERVTVRLGGAARDVVADRDGRWRAELPAMRAGGPYRLSATGAAGAVASADDVLIGDVWLCAGQSNMEWPVVRALNGEDEAAAADDPMVRLLTVQQRTALLPETSLPADVGWRAATPDGVRDFSAACWFMVRGLRRSENVPIGAIDASWGGTRIRPWTDAAAGDDGAQGDAELLALYRRDPAAAASAFADRWGVAWRTINGIAADDAPWRAPDRSRPRAASGRRGRLDWRRAPRVGPWERWGLPALASYDGHVWMRRTVTLSAAEADGGATLSLGIVDDLDQTFVNGVGVGSTFGWALPRDYRIAPGVLRPGLNEIIVNVGDSWGAGGFQGPADRLRLVLAGGAAKPLGDGWDYAIDPTPAGTLPRAPWDSHGGLAVIYNAMIAPLRDVGLRGVAWYQGESDVGLAGYDRRLTAMMGSWRRLFAAPDLPFLVVGLANFGVPAARPGPSAWADLREAQRRAVIGDAHAALVQAIDLGEWRDIHPANKQEIGRRLASAARSPTGRGPSIAAVRRTQGGVELSFRGVAGSLRTLSGGGPIAFELCGPAQDSCRWASAVVRENVVVLRDDGRAATRVRYAWSDSPVVNLYDDALLPLGPFEMALPAAAS